MPSDGLLGWVYGLWFVSFFFLFLVNTSSILVRNILCGINGHLS